jgi:AraC-like DNA-binding protein/DNA-binding MarR family transcriptional regulator
MGVKAQKDISTSKLLLVLARAYHSLSEFLQAGLARQGVCFMDFMILEALLHKGPLSTSVIGSKIVQLPNMAMRPAIDRLNRRGLIRRQRNRNDAITDAFELTDEGRNQVSKLYETHKKDIEVVMDFLSLKQRTDLWQVLKKIGLRADRCQHARSKDRRGGLARWQLRRVTEYMTECVADSVRLEELAAQTGLSSSHFGRAFKLSIGVSPHRWQMNLRILEAQELLREGKLPLAEISIATGFAEQSHFQRVFKEVVGVSPGAWQRDLRL